MNPGDGQPVPGSAGPKAGPQRAAGGWRAVAVPRWLASLLILLAALAAAALSWQLTHPPAPHYTPPPEQPRGTFHEVLQVVPPLSLRLEDGSTVRIAGVSRPEGPEEAARLEARLRELVPPGTVVYVEPEAARTEETDTGRFASVYLPPIGVKRTRPFPYAESRLVNSILVQEGLVRTDSPQLYRYANEFEMLEHDARQHKRGIWGDQR